MTRAGAKLIVKARPGALEPAPRNTLALTLGIGEESVRRHQLERLLPVDAVPEAIRKGELPTAGDRRVLTILFIDIRSSSRIEETLSPQQTIQFLNIYLGLAANAIVANRGSVTQYIGDGVLAIFGMLEEPNQGAADALAAAEAIHRAFESANAPSGLSEPIRAVVAVHTGPAIVGVVGGVKRSDYAVFGSSVNIASRLEGEAKELGLRTVLSGSTVASLRELPPSLRLVTRKILRGLSERVEIWTTDLVPPPGRVRPEETGVDRRDAVGAGSETRSSAFHRRSWTAFATLAIAAAISVTGLAATVGLGVGGDQFLVKLVDLAQVIAALIAATTCAWTAKQSAGRLRFGWALIAASAGAWSVGQASWSIYELGQVVAPMSPSLSDAGFLAALPLGLAGVLMFWTSPLGSTDGWRVLLDGLVVIAALVFAAWALGLKQMYLLPAQSSTEQAIELAYPLGEILFGTVVILAINRGARQLQGPLLLLLAGFAVSATAYVIAAHADVDSYGAIRGFINTGLVLAFLLIAVAPLWPARPSDRATVSGELDLWQLALPWIAVVFAALSALVVVLSGESLDRFLTVLTAVLAVSLALSQALTNRQSLSMVALSRLSAKALADVITHSPIGIARSSADFVVIDANPSLGALLHEPPELVVGSPITRYLPPEIQLQMRQKLSALGRGEADRADADIPMIRADGDRAWVNLTSTAVRKSNGQVDYFLTMLQDTTARHQVEDAARVTFTQLEQLNQLKIEFLQSVGHEFRTALMGIEGFSELIRDTVDLSSNDVKEFASEIYKSAEHLDSIVTEILDVDRIETGHVGMSMGSVDVNAIIRREVEEVKAGSDGLTFTERLDPTLTPIVGDAAQLSQLVSTLLHHAAKYSPDGGQIVIVSRMHAGQAEVSVRDQGLSVRADFDNPLFAPSDLYAKNPIRRVVGTGLGMGIARQIVALHGGRFWVDHLQGIGSEAHVTLPAGIPGLRLASGATATSAPQASGGLREAQA
jgi:PAS domain S-box-containing protein